MNINNLEDLEQKKIFAKKYLSSEAMKKFEKTICEDHKVIFSCLPSIDEYINKFQKISEEFVKKNPLAEYSKASDKFIKEYMEKHPDWAVETFVDLTAPISTEEQN